MFSLKRDLLPHVSTDDLYVLRFEVDDENETDSFSEAVIETDPAWKNSFLEDYPIAVKMLSSLIRDEMILHRLASAQLLTSAEIIYLTGHKSDSDAARCLLLFLMKGKPGSYKAFCDVIRETHGGLHRILSKHLTHNHESTARDFSNDCDPRTSFASDYGIFPMTPEPELREIWKERNKCKALEVFVAAFLYNNEKEWILTSVCCHDMEEMKEVEKKYREANWISCNNCWKFSLNDERKECAVKIQLADDQKENWVQENTVVFQRSNLMSSGISSSRITAKPSISANSLHFRAEYQHDGKVVQAHTFSFFISSLSSPWEIALKVAGKIANEGVRIINKWLF